MKNFVFEKDLYRYYGDKGESFKSKMLRPLEIQFLCVFRKLQACKNPIARFFLKSKYRRLTKKTQIQIPIETKIGEGFYIGHTGRVIINPKVIIGRNVNVATGVTIGQENRGARKGTPIIGDNCWIGTNSVIVGNVKIGSDVLIAPLTFVNFDVPDHSVVIGNPAKIIFKENATQDYVTKTV